MTADEEELDSSDLTIPGFQGRPTPVRTLYLAKRAEAAIHLVATPDNMHVYLQLLPGPDFNPVAAEDLAELLHSAGVSVGIDDYGLKLYASIQNSDKPFDGFFQVAKGEPAHNGEDSYIEFHVQPSAAVPHYDENDSGSIDYKQLNLLENCFASQRIATIIPPGQGKPGRDAFGTPIPPEPGKPLEIKAGPGVMISDNGRDFTSEIKGRVIYEKGTISVSPVLEISHGIDYSVGNLDFVGKIVVNGSLLDGFSIRGKRGVEINGDCGAANVVSEGEVIIRGGVKGRGSAKILCRGLQARYIDNANVEASGDVVVNKEILHSSIKTLGKVSIDHGAILGGEIWAFQGVEAESIGSEIGVPTLVVSGLSWTDEKDLLEVRGQIAEYDERVQAAKILLEPLLTAPSISARLGLDQKSIIADLVGELRMLRDALSDLTEEKDRIVNRQKNGQACQINVVKELFVGVNVRFTEISDTIKDTVKGPLSVIQDVTRGVVSITGFK